MDGITGIRTATIYRMVMDKHICPYGLQAKDLLEREGLTVDGQWLKTRDETDAFKHEHHVESTPQVFIGGYDALTKHLSHPPTDPDKTTYTTVPVVFAVAAFMALAVVWMAVQAMSGYGA